MSKILLIALFAIFSFGNDLKKIESFEADFKQIIINSSDKKIQYDGKLYIKKPSLFFWKYEAPIQKLVYITKKHVTIVEPELEQAIITKLSNELNIIKIIDNARKISKDKYEATLYEKKYQITFKDNNLSKIEYNDELENKVTLSFFNIKQNKPIDSQIFKYNIPNEYDIIRK
jgi:outer membrane lipoprotein carrier protein